MNKSFFFVPLAVLLFSSCATIVQPGEVAIKQRRGKLNPKYVTEGIVRVSPFTTTLIKVKTSTVNREVRLNLPSKEGLNVSSEISILYHVDESKAVELIRSVGRNYEEILVLSTFRSAAADVCAKFYAKDMHSGKRSEIEAEIKEKMAALLQERGIIIEAVLLKSISLPPGLYAAIEAKLRAEQESQQMEFILTRERQEAERKAIEATGIKNAQNILKEAITEENIRWKSLEVFQELSNSPNTKIIITNGSTPMLIDPEVTQ